MADMMKKKLKWSILLLWVFSLMNIVKCKNQFTNSAIISPFMNEERLLSNLTTAVAKEIRDLSSFCVKDLEAEWDQAFNFNSMEFLAACMKTTQGDMAQRICTRAEIKLYFSSVFKNSTNKSKPVNYFEPNENCNLTSWVPGCDPGWACSISQDLQPDYLENSDNIPARTDKCKACCEGFFCPNGITCMIPCPLGSHCPLAEPNNRTGVCEPYNYQVKPNGTCGGANIWADVDSSKEMFCSAGSFCPTPVQKNNCSGGHYCRMGSTAEKRCFKLVSCKANSEKEDIHAYGIMLIVALVAILLVIYSCSDKVLTVRERRLAKSREVAAKSARKTSVARRRWRTAKDAAKKQASGLKSHLSKTFSFQKFSEDPEKIMILNQDESETRDDLYASMCSSTSSTYQPLCAPSKGKKNATGDLMPMIHENEDDHDGRDGIMLEILQPKDTRQMPKEKQKNTNTQIFKYAYAQLEKEKAMAQENKELTFTGVVKMATDPEIKRRPRPLIEISFKDLTVTLKAKNKHLLRCVTGKIMPGHITAVMGPSGAGKTTFLSALAGKPTGCRTTGEILINGENESIHSYKKITGFVPQDDIVHGDLTVEENLWFSANCRLSSDLSKADKVLIVERVIESLGLQTVRDSLVGTVEKRGISGGQKKRVNVGLEMVMEPSVLFLDEPTSGLDSASSQLLLQALRREALEGVNICMVVHQPSFTLFRMFDDLVLLAKGGLVVYHGSARKVEEYFAGLGIHVPERINPPDYYIDILEGKVMPSASSHTNYEELPIRWMLHNGYPIPQDMRKITARLVSIEEINPVNELNLGSFGETEQSFSVELWQDVKSHVQLHQDKITHNFLKSRDLSNRRTPGLFMQYRRFLGRVIKQRLREAKIQATDYLILLLAGVCLGSLAKVNDQKFGTEGYIYTIIAVSLLGKIAALRSFSLDKLQYWRESASGMSSLAYFLAKDTIDHFNTIIKPAVYLSLFYSFTNPRSSFADNYVVMLCLIYCVTGIAYALAIFLEPGPAQLCSVVLPVVLTLIATQPNNSASKSLKNIVKLCYPKWALEAFVISNAERYYGVWLITRCGLLLTRGYNVHNWGLCLSILILTGAVTRVVSFFGMITFKRK